MLKKTLLLIGRAWCAIIGHSFPMVIIVGAAGPVEVNVPVKKSCGRCAATVEEIATIPAARRQQIIQPMPRHGADIKLH